jgi:predicted nucleic acid-binding protein
MADQTCYVLDTFALIAFFNREVGHEAVRSALREALLGQAEVAMSEINWGEMFYMTAKKAGLPQAELRLKHVERLPIMVVPVMRPLVKAAALFKVNYSTSKHPLSYADCFAAALAQHNNAALLTGDPEFKAVANAVSIQWIKPV